MTTYASPRLTRVALMVAITILFLIGAYIFATGIFHTINTISKNSRIKTEESGNINSTASTVTSVTNLKTNDIDNENNEPRFPSLQSSSVELIFGVITLGHAMFGIVAVTQERTNLLATYSHILIISCFIKLLFLFGK